MKKIGFIGAFDKTDLIIHVAKITAEVGKKVLIIDATEAQRARYVVPCIAPAVPSVYYITEYEQMDVAVGFENIASICEYLGVAELEYDLVCVDIDSSEAFKEYKMEEAEHNFFVTAFDNYSLKKGLDIIGKLEKKVPMTKVLFSREMLDEENEYLDFVSFYVSIEWSNSKIFFPYDQGISTVFIKNHRTARVRFREFDPTAKDSFMTIAEMIASDVKSGEFKKAFKRLQ